MIKLLTILNEIKIQAQINPQLVADMYENLYDKYVYISQNITNTLWDILEDNLDKKTYNDLSLATGWNNHILVDRFEKISFQSLKNIYKELKELEKFLHGGINEIQVKSNKITPERIIELIDDLIDKKSWYWINVREYILKQPWFKGYIDNDIRKLSSSELNKIWKDINNIIKNNNG